MNNYKYLYNKVTKKLHIINGCCHSRNNNLNDTNIKFYKSEDECVKEHQTYFAKCKLCFKELRI